MQNPQTPRPPVEDLTLRVKKYPQKCPQSSKLFQLCLPLTHDSDSGICFLPGKSTKCHYIWKVKISRMDTVDFEINRTHTDIFLCIYISFRQDIHDAWSRIGNAWLCLYWCITCHTDRQLSLGLWNTCRHAKAFGWNSLRWTHLLSGWVIPVLSPRLIDHLYSPIIVSFVTNFKLAHTPNDL